MTWVTQSYQVSYRLRSCTTCTSYQMKYALPQLGFDILLVTHLSRLSNHLATVLEYVSLIQFQSIQQHAQSLYQTNPACLL